MSWLCPEAHTRARPATARPTVQQTGQRRRPQTAARATDPGRFVKASTSPSSLEPNAARVAPNVASSRLRPSGAREHAPGPADCPGPPDPEGGRMLDNRSMPRCSVIPELVYPDVDEAVRWLSE